MSLSSEQLLLLNNLSYLNEKCDLTNSKGKTLGQVVNEMLDPGSSTISDTTSSSEEQAMWRDIATAIQQDSTLSNMTITCANRREGGEGLLSYVVVDSTGSEAVLVNEGTISAAEWRDNFTGGGPTNQDDGVSTAHQVEMLEWFQSAEVQEALKNCDTITTTGHSKGGNIAQYIALLDNRVDRCVSFDGQGFSDQFMDKYGTEIALRQDMITNYCAEGDYVNLLLNKLGTSIYLEGQWDTNNPLLNHDPKMLNCFDADGNPVPFSEYTTTQSPVMKALDEYLNSMLRSLPEDRVGPALHTIGEVVSILCAGEFMSSGDDATLGDLAVDAADLFMVIGSNKQVFKDIFGFTIAYTLDSNGPLMEYLDTIIPGIADISEGVLDVVRTLQDMPEWAKWTLQQLSDFIGDKLEKFIPGLTGDLISLLMGFIVDLITGEYPLPEVEDGDDRNPVSVPDGTDRFRFEQTYMEQTAAALRQLAASLRDYADSASSLAARASDAGILCNLSVGVHMLLEHGSVGTPASLLRSVKRAQNRLAGQIDSLTSIIDQISQNFRSMEKRIMDESSEATLTQGFGGGGGGFR